MRRIEVPEQFEADTNYITADPDTMSMLRELGMNKLHKITITSDTLQRDRDTSPFHPRRYRPTSLQVARGLQRKHRHVPS